MAGFFDQWPEREPSRDNAFAVNPIARQSEHRDAEAVARAMGDAAARLYLFEGDDALVRAAGAGRDALFERAAAVTLGLRTETLVLLGWTAAGPRLAAFAAPAVELESLGVERRDLRGLANEALLPPEQLGGLAQGRSLLLWHQRHGFCARCGAATEVVDGGTRRHCPACGAEHFPRTDPVVIMLVVAGDECLLGRGVRFVADRYSCLAGYMEPGETVEDAVRREVFEETTVRVGRVHYHASQPWPFPSTLMIGCYGEAESRDIVIDPAELADARWFGREELRRMLARSHPGGLTSPPPFAIANRLMRNWAAGS